MKFKLHILLLLFMILSFTQIEQYIKKPQNSKSIKEAIENEKVLQAYSTGEYQKVVLDKYLSWFVEERRDNFRDKFEIHSKPIMNKVYTHFERCFNAQGRLVDASFTDFEHKADFEAYLDSTAYKGVNNEDFYRKEVLNSLLFLPNKVLYIDFPQEYAINETRSNPIVCSVNIQEVKDVDASYRGIEYIIFKKERKDSNNKTINQYFAIDDEKYVLYESQGSSNLTLVAFSEHNFVTCPARFVSDYNYYNDKYIVKKSPVSDSIPDLEQWLLLKNLAKIYQWENGVPIKFEPEQPCKNRQNFDNYNGVDYGWVECTDGYFVLDGSTQVACSNCKSRKSQEKFSWGKQIEIPLAYFTNENGINKPVELLKSFGHIETDVNFLKFNGEDVKSKREQIEIDIIGKGFSATKEARNEVDVKADVEDLKRVLSSVSETIESNWLWVEEKILEARGYDSLISHNVFLGREYLLQSKQQHQAEYKQLIDAGADDFLLNKKLFEIAQAEYAHNKNAIQIFEILASIIPFRHVPIEKMYANSSIYLLNEATTKDFYLRIYASQWIQEFKVNNDLAVWGSDIDFSQKVESLQAYFDEKVEEILTSNQNLIS